MSPRFSFRSTHGGLVSSKLRTPLAVIVLVFGLSACGGDDPTGINSGDPLTEAEIQEVLLALFGALDAVELPTQAAAAAPAMVSVSQTFDASAPCEGGGTISLNGGVNGTVDDVTGAYDVSFSLTMDPNSCTVPSSSGSITLNGSPDLRFAFDYEGDDSQFTAAGRYEGGIAFTHSDGRSGSCAFDLDFNITADFTGGSSTQSTSGSVCGVSANQFEVIDF